MRGEDERRAAVRDRAEIGEEPLGELAIEVRGRLVEEEHARLADERAGERDTLALAAGETVDRVARAGRDAEAGEGALGERFAAPPREAIRYEREHHVVEDGHSADEREVLKEVAHLAPAHLRAVAIAEARDRFAVDPDLARGREEHPSEDGEEGRLPAPARAGDDRDLAREDVERDAAEHVAAALAVLHALGHVTRRQHRAHGARYHCRAARGRSAHDGAEVVAPARRVSIRCRPMRRFVLVPLLALPILAACKKDSVEPVSSQPTETRPSASPAPPSATPSAIASAVGPAPACKVLSQKTWGKGANREAGLTIQEVDGARAAIGLAFGYHPHVLVIGKGGDGKLAKVTLKAGTDLAKAPPAAEGTRHVMRVTPTKVNGDLVEAFVDYRDEYKNKRRRVACGPADSSDAWISFDDTPFLERDDKPSGDALKAIFTKKKEADADEGYHELRDCRTFADLKKGSTWIVGSDLLGKLEPDGSTIGWRASLVVDKGAKVHELHTHDVKLGNEGAAKTGRFEIPVSHPLHDGGYLLAARYQGSLVAAILGPEKTLQGTVHSYPGMPTLPDIAADGDDTVLVTSFVKSKTEFTLRGLRVGSQKPELPKAMTPVTLAPDDKDSETDPDFTRDGKGRRWLSYVDGERGHGKLFIAPIGADFTAVGHPFEITQGGERASEARLVALGDGTILVVYLREQEGEKSYELVTEDLECDVVK